MTVEAGGALQPQSVDESFAWTYRELKQLARARLRHRGSEAEDRGKVGRGDPERFVQH